MPGGPISNIPIEKRNSFSNMPPEKHQEIIKMGHEARKKLNPAPPKRKKDLSGERLRLIEDVTNKIKNVLVEKDLNYTQFAELMDMSSANISNLMTGKRNMTLLTIADIGEALGCQFTFIVSPKVD